MSTAKLDSAALDVEVVLQADQADIALARTDADAILQKAQVQLPDVCGWWSGHGPKAREWLDRLRSNFILKIASLVAPFIKSLADLGDTLATVLDRLCNVDTTKKTVG